MKDRIRAVRKSLGLTQREFGEKIGATRAMIASYEGGSVLPSDPILKLISKEFNVSYDWLKYNDQESEGFSLKENSSYLTEEYWNSIPNQLRILADALESIDPECRKKLEAAMRKAGEYRQ